MIPTYLLRDLTSIPASLLYVSASFLLWDNPLLWKLYWSKHTTTGAKSKGKHTPYDLVGPAIKLWPPNRDRTKRLFDDPNSRAVSNSPRLFLKGKVLDPQGTIIFFIVTILKLELSYLSILLANNKGNAVPNCVINMWQASHDGFYSIIGFELRGKITTDENGNYEIETVLPGHYGIPQTLCNLVNKLTLGIAGRVLGGHFHMGPQRAAHIHVQLWRKDERVWLPWFMRRSFMTTQLYFAKDECLETDFVNRVYRQRPLTENQLLLTKHSSETAELKERNMDQEFYTATFNFVIPY
eukprot:GEZU01015800.1.p1 GENE.GEZU01015800.1~~GEZU01015800.1.p1  ORF type:complete len:296 (-),score=31.73 GEZU01015800.1:213-1100(-)